MPILPFFSKNLSGVKKKVQKAAVYVIRKAGFTPVIVDGKIGVKTAKGVVHPPENTPLSKLGSWFLNRLGNPKDMIYEEPDDDTINKGSIDKRKEKLPEFYEGEVLPAQTKPNVSKIKEWVIEVKFKGMSPIELRMEYNRTKGTTSDAPLTANQFNALVDSVAYKISRKIWYVGRRSSSETDAQWQRKTRHMRPAMGSYSPNEKWTGDFPYDETYEYTVGDIDEGMEKLKRGERVSW